MSQEITRIVTFASSAFNTPNPEAISLTLAVLGTIWRNICCPQAGSRLALEILHAVLSDQIQKVEDTTNMESSCPPRADFSPTL
jgi:hypothetical protein